MATVLETLERFGIEADAGEIDQMVARATEELLSEWRPLDPRANLSDTEVEELRDGGLILEPRHHGQEDPVLRSAAQYGALIATGLSVNQVAGMLGGDSSRVRHRLAARTTYGVRLRFGWRIPVFQFDDERLLPGIDLVLPRLPEDLHPMEVVGWFTTPDPDLASGDRVLSPREWLREGRDPGKVAGLAAGLDHEL